MSKLEVGTVVAGLVAASVTLGVGACSTPSGSAAPLPPLRTAAATPTAPAPVRSARPAASSPPHRSVPAVPAPSPCRTERRWSAGPKSNGGESTFAGLYLTRVGRHGCYDRVVFDLNGPRDAGPAGVAIAASYIDIARADPSGRPVPVPGGATLRVTVAASFLWPDSQGHQPWRGSPKIGESLLAPGTLTGWRSLRAVAFAGSIDGRTTVAIGVRERLGFRIWSYSEHDYQHVVVDIAH